jgi:hypothetical protein
MSTPQSISTHSAARDEMCENAEGEHSHAKSVKAQPISEAAEVIQGILINVRINYILIKGCSGRETYSTGRNCSRC